MKLIEAWIDDPLRRGVAERPSLYVEVDEAPRLTIEAELFEEGWETARYGAFVKYMNANSRVTDSDYNIFFAGTYPPVIDCKVILDAKVLRSDLSIDLKRARSVLKKSHGDWVLKLNDAEAMNGGMKWTALERNPPCKWFDPRTKSICGMRMHRIVKSKDVSVPYCKAHFDIYTQKQIERRKATA